MDRPEFRRFLKEFLFFWQRAVRMRALGIVLSLMIGSAACGGGSGPSTSASGALSGNWQISLAQTSSSSPLIYTGFMLDSSNSVTGNLILGSPQCPGVGPVTGTDDGSGNVSLSINEFGQKISLKGTQGSSQPLSGSYSYPSGNCATSAASGTWSALVVKPVTGTFKGTFTSSLTKAVLPVSGTLTQGPNTGDSTASITGTVQSTGSTFCQYVSQATVSGMISGTAVALNLYGPNGQQITQIGQVGELNNILRTPGGVCGPPGNSPILSCLLVTPDAQSMSGTYVFPSLSSACPADWGTVQFTFSSTPSAM